MYPHHYYHLNKCVNLYLDLQLTKGAVTLNNFPRNTERFSNIIKPLASDSLVASDNRTGSILRESIKGRNQSEHSVVAFTS